MPISKKYLAEFFENQSYHIYNRTNNKEKLFLNDDNYYFFLEKYNKYLSIYLDTYSWNLLPNHFHFVVGVKSVRKIKKAIHEKPLYKRTIMQNGFLQDKITLNKLIVHEFKRFFQCYTGSINSWHKRKGNLFYKCFKRVRIEGPLQFNAVLIYVHLNAFRHGIVKDFMKHRWSSWSKYTNENLSDIELRVLKWFGGKKKFIQSHLDMINFY